MITIRLKVVVAFILLLILLIIGYDLFKTLQRNNALYRDLRSQLALRNEPAISKLDGTSFIGDIFFDFVLRDISDHLWQLSNIRSQLKLIIVFSLDDCHLCLQEYPIWRKIDEIYQKEQITIIGISHHTEKEALISFAGERNLRFPILLDPEDSIRNKMGFRISPLRILLDADNKILELAVPDANLERQRQILDNLAYQLNLIQKTRH